MLAYSRETSSNAQRVWVVCLDGGVETPVSDETFYNDQPVWSPDGRRLAYFATDLLAPVTSNRFVVVDPDGSNALVLPARVGGPPSWSPDGRTLLGIGIEDYGATMGRSIIAVDIESATSTAVPIAGLTETGAEVQGTPSWQRLAD